MNKFEYKNLTPFKWFVLENFPFIEADFDALTEWQLFCKLGKEINKIITSENTLGTQMEDVTNSFIELQNYVNNYFNNLDVQEEINNKLNDMVEDGTLQEIITEYLQIKGMLVFNSVSDMKQATNLINGSFVKTYGFYNINDGGGSYYKVREITNQDNVNEMNLIALKNQNLVAELINNQIVNVKQYGAKGDNENDDIENIQIAISNNNGKTIFFPKGTYLISKPINITSAKIKLVGEGNESTEIKKTTTNASNYQRSYNEENFDFNNYPSVINLIFPNNSNISNITIENLNINCNSRTNYGIVAPHISYSKISNCRINNALTAIVYGGWVNEIEKCTFLGCRELMTSYIISLATIVKNCHSNQGAYIIRNATNFSFIECSADNGNPCWDIGDSKSVNLTDCSTETYNFCVRCSNANVFIHGGDYEGHTASEVTWQGFFVVQNNGNLILNGSYIHFENYAELELPNDRNIIKSTNGYANLNNCIINTPYEYKNYVASGSGKVIIDDSIKSNTQNKTGIITKTLASIKEEIARLPFSYGTNYSIFIKAYGQITHTSIALNGMLSATANGSNTIISDNINAVSTSEYSGYNAYISAERDSEANELVLYFNQTNNLAIPLKYDIEYNK